MAGGVGERFWPQSRRRKPKQLINLTGGGSMISLTVDRARWVSKPEEIFIVTVADQKEAIAAEVGRVLPVENIIGEPVGRNTAPSVGLAALVIKDRYGDIPFVVLPADHVVEGRERYESIVRGAERYAGRNDCLLTFGIKPTRPETGYGYVEAGDALAEGDGLKFFNAKSFREKPSEDQAKRFLELGSFFWNSGMFCWRPVTVLEAIAEHIPDLWAVLSDIGSRMGTTPLEEVLKSAYARAPSISIDYGVMEKADNVVVLESDFYWNDVGNWESIRDIYPHDDQGNVLVGDHMLIDGAGNTIFSPDRSVGVIGLNDVVIVDGGDSILVCSRDRTQQVRDMVDSMRKKGKDKLL